MPDDRPVIAEALFSLSDYDGSGIAAFERYRDRWTAYEAVNPDRREAFFGYMMDRKAEHPESGKVEVETHEAPVEIGGRTFRVAAVIVRAA